MLDCILYAPTIQAQLPLIRLFSKQFGTRRLGWLKRFFIINNCLSLFQILNSDVISIYSTNQRVHTAYQVWSCRLARFIDISHCWSHRSIAFLPLCFVYIGAFSMEFSLNPYVLGVSVLLVCMLPGKPSLSPIVRSITQNDCIEIEHIYCLWIVVMLARI